MTACRKRIFGGMARCPRGRGPLAERPVRGPMPPWRTLAWLFLSGLRPRRAHLRFAKHGHYSASPTSEKPGSHPERRHVVSSCGLHRLSSLPRRSPRGRQGQSESFNRLGCKMPSVFLIRRPTSARRSQGIIGVRPRGPGWPPQGGRIHEGMDRGVAARDKNGANNLATQDRDKPKPQPVRL